MSYVLLFSWMSLSIFLISYLRYLYMCHLTLMGKRKLSKSVYGLGGWVYVLHSVNQKKEFVSTRTLQACIRRMSCNKSIRDVEN